MIRYHPIGETIMFFSQRDLTDVRPDPIYPRYIGELTDDFSHLFLYKRGYLYPRKYFYFLFFLPTNLPFLTSIKAHYRISYENSGGMPCIKTTPALF